MKRRDSNKIPEFRTLEEEREYWEARGPLAEGHRGRVNRPHPKQKRASFLSVRLTGEELTQLRDVAAKIGMGPSTFARYLLKQTIEQNYLDFFLLSNPHAVSAHRAQPQYIHETANDEDSDKRICILDPDRLKRDPVVLRLFLEAICAGAKVITPKDPAYKSLEKLIKSESSKSPGATT